MTKPMVRLAEALAQKVTVYFRPLARLKLSCRNCRFQGALDDLVEIVSLAEEVPSLAEPASRTRLPAAGDTTFSVHGAVPDSNEPFCTRLLGAGVAVGPGVGDGPGVGVLVGGAVGAGVGVCVGAGAPPYSYAPMSGPAPLGTALPS